MRALLVGAVESTRIALKAIAAASQWDLAAVMTLPPDLAKRHSDFADLSNDARALGADLILAADSNAPEVLEQIRAIAPDQVFVIGWSQICRAPFREACGGEVIGYHPAPLPRLRGRGVLPWTILLQEPITAGTLFWLDDGVDSGPILAQQYFHVGAEETVGSLYDRHLDVLAGMMAGILPDLAAGNAVRRPQQEQFASYAARRTPADGLLNWTEPAEKLARLVRAVGRPYPGAFTSTRAGRLTIWAGSVEAGYRHQAASPGQVVEVSEADFAVRCGEGVLRVQDWEAEAPGPPALHSRLGGRA